jgi:hypothetical protein
METYENLHSGPRSVQAARARGRETGCRTPGTSLGLPRSVDDCAELSVMAHLRKLQPAFCPSQANLTAASTTQKLRVVQNKIIRRIYDERAPLWSSGQSFWLQIQRSGFDSRHYQIF